VIDSRSFDGIWPRGGRKKEQSEAVSAARNGDTNTLPWRDQCVEVASETIKQLPVGNHPERP
jgi:hypothetical protein